MFSSSIPITIISFDLFLSYRSLFLFYSFSLQPWFVPNHHSPGSSSSWESFVPQHSAVYPHLPSRRTPREHSFPPWPAEPPQSSGGGRSVPYLQSFFSPVKVRGPITALERPLTMTAVFWNAFFVLATIENIIKNIHFGFAFK